MATYNAAVDYKITNQSFNQWTNLRMQVFKLMKSLNYVFHLCGINTVEHPMMRVDHPSWHVLLLDTPLPIIVLLNPGLIGSLKWWLYVEGQRGCRWRCDGSIKN